MSKCERDTCCFARSMVDVNRVKDYHWNTLVDLQQQGYLPDLDKKVNYKVYSLRGKEWGAHKSIILTADDEHFVSVELIVEIGVDGKKQTFPLTRPIPKEKIDKENYLGEVSNTAKTLIFEKALEVMKKFGCYFKPCNNCQDFCNKYVKAIGLPTAEEITDADKGWLATIASVIVAVGLGVLSRIR